MYQTTLLKLFFICICSIGLSLSIEAQTCSDNLDCNNNPPIVEATFTNIDNVPLCGDPVEVRIKFTIDGFPANFDFFDNDLRVCLNPGNNASAILYAGIPANSNYQVIQGTIGSGDPIHFELVDNGGPSLPFVPDLVFYVQANCALWDQVPGGQLLNHSLHFSTRVLGSNQPGDPDIRCVLSDSAPFDIAYSVVHFGEANQVEEVQIKTPFNLSIPLEIGGTNCNPNNHSEIKLSVELSEEVSTNSNTNLCVNFANYTNFCINNPSPISGTNTYEIILHPDALSEGQALCATNFPAGMGEATLFFENLIMNKCPDNSALVTYRVDNCPNPANCTPADCSQITQSYLFVDKFDYSQPEYN